MKIDLSKRIEWIKARTELDEYTISLIEFQMKEIVIEVTSELKKLRVTDVSGRSELFTCKNCGTHEKQWSRKNDDWYCKTCGHICR
jgi:hypothetical protein